MTVFEKNIDAIAKKNTELATRISQTKTSPRIKRGIDEPGRVAITVEGPDGSGVLHFPDMHRPRLEADLEGIAWARMVVVLGFGSGSLLGEVVARTSEQAFILLIEPDIDLFAAVLQEADLSSVLELERVSLSVGESPRAATFAHAENEFGVFTLINFPVVENSWSAPIFLSQ